MNGKGPRKKRKAVKKPAGSFLTRLLRGGKEDKAAGKGSPKGGKVQDPEAGAKAKSLSPLERSIQEIKHLSKVGESDPERLAMMLSKLLQQERVKREQDQADFDRMVWDIVRKSEGDDDGGDASADDTRPSG